MNIPFERITEFGQQTMLDSRLFNISWILGRFCNYKCSYCWPYANSEKLDFQDLDTYIRVINEIKRQANQNGFDQFHWSFSGGEPTAYKQLPELIKHIERDMICPYQSIHLTTNLSPSLKWWKNFSNITDTLQRRSITASFHAEFAKESEFADKCLQLMDDRVFVTVNQVMVPSQFYQLFDRLQRFADKGINVTLKPQSNLTADAIVDGYTDEMIQLMRTGFPQTVNDAELYQVRLTDGINNYYIDQAERFNSLGFNRFKSWNCNAGFQSVVIRGNEIKRAYSCKEQGLGTLNDFELFNSAMPCVTETCVSSADSKIPKRR